MDYINLYQSLRNQINFDDDFITTDHLNIYNFTFESKATALLSGTTNYRCEDHRLNFDHCEQEFKTDMNEDELMLNTKDIQIIDNKRFRYHIFMPENIRKTNRFILLFHGFNEKSWDKYYPWAKKLVEHTGKAVVLFPIAFHMNRAPGLWRSRYEMFELSKKRQASFPLTEHSTFSNVAISIHVHARPQRFIWSGLQTYYDVIQLMDQIRGNNHPLFEKDTKADIFAYSIGGLLGQSLMMTNTKNYFSNSKLCLFCSGAAFNRIQAASKFIIDSEGSLALYSFLVEHLDHHLKNNPRLAHYVSEVHPEGMNLMSLINYHKMIEYREDKFREMSDRIMAVGMKKDSVYPYYEIENTLKGISHDIPVKVNILDYDFSYKHEDPFPPNKKYEDIINEGFEQAFELMGGFLKD